MTGRRRWKSPAAQAGLFSGVLLLAWVWDAASSGHLEEQLTRAALGGAMLIGAFAWMNRQGKPGGARQMSKPVDPLGQGFDTAPAPPLRHDRVLTRAAGTTSAAAGR